MNKTYQQKENKKSGHKKMAAVIAAIFFIDKALIYKALIASSCSSSLALAA